MPCLNRRASGLVSILLAAGLLVVGLWPFAFAPPNRVGWLKDRAGLSFQPNGLAYDPETVDWFAGGPPAQTAAITLELWLEPRPTPPTDAFHILTIDDGQFPSSAVLYQWKAELLLRIRDAARKRGYRELETSNILSGETPCFFTVTADSSGTEFYLNGSSLSRYPGFTVPRSQLHGRLILGNAAAGKHPWTGDMLGLAVFQRAVGASEVVQHYQLWTNHQAERLTTESGLAALYLFDEGSGQWAKDRSANRHRLFIPDRYHVLQKRVLEMPWGPDPIGWSDLDDIAVNIFGFVPFGFMVYNYRRLAKPGGWNVTWATAAGAIISLAIELTQVWLPNRTSSATDLLCNTLGTMLGALIVRGIQSRTAPTGQ